MKVALYARVSTERQAERGTIGSQLAVLRENANAADHELISEYVDDGHSGARVWPDRRSLAAEAANRRRRRGAPRGARAGDQGYPDDVRPAGP
jgi:hypothetical protein